MKATVREYTAKKKVVVVEFTEEEASTIALHGATRYGTMITVAVRDAFEADRAEEQRREDEDVPF